MSTTGQIATSRCTRSCVDGEEIDADLRQARPRGPRPELPPAARRLHAALPPFPKGEARTGRADRRASVRHRQAARGPARRARGAHHDDPVQGRDRHARAAASAPAASSCWCAASTARTCCCARARCGRSRTRPSSDIVSKIVQEAGFQADCDPSGEPHDFVQQDNETDWDFIWRLAERIGFEFVVEDQTAHFRKPTPEGAIELEWPTTLRSFNPRVTAVQQVKEVSLLAQDPKTKQAIDVTVSTPSQIAQIGVDRETVASAFDDATMHIATEPVKSQAEGEALAQALLDKLANGYIAAEGVTDGNPQIRAGAKVSVSGVGREVQRHLPRRARDSRAARREHLRDALRRTRSRTRCSARPGRTGAARVPSFGSQLVLGIVTNNDDPDDMGRVRVRYPALGPRRRRRLGADRHAERRQERGAADAAGRRRGGAGRLRARRHDAAVRARLAVQRPGHARRRSAAGQGRVVRAQERQADLHRVASRTTRSRAAAS